MADMTEINSAMEGSMRKSKSHRDKILAETLWADEALLVQARRQGRIHHWYHKVRQGQHGFCVQRTAANRTETWVALGGVRAWLVVNTVADSESRG